MSVGEKQSQPSSPDDASTVTFGSFSPETSAVHVHKAEVEKLLAVIRRGSSQENRHLLQLQEQAQELADLKAQLHHFNTCHPQLCRDHQALLTQYSGLREDHAWLSSEHLSVYSEHQRQRGRVESLEQESQQAKQQLAAQDADAARLQTQLDASEMVKVELRIEKAAVQNLQHQLFLKQQSEADQQRRLESLEAECASLHAADDQQKQEADASRSRIQDLTNQLQASQDYCSNLFSTLEEVRTATKMLQCKVRGCEVLLPMANVFRCHERYGNECNVCRGNQKSLDNLALLKPLEPSAWRQLMRMAFLQHIIAKRSRNLVAAQSPLWHPSHLMMDR